MMKKFNLAALSVAILGSFSAAAEADLYTVQQLETPANYRNLVPRDLNDQGMLAVLSRLPQDTEIDLTKLSSSALAAVGIPSDADLETYELSYRQYNGLISFLQDNVSGNLLNPRYGTNAATSYDGQNFRFISPLDGQTDLSRATSSTIDTQFHGLNDNNVFVGLTSSAYTELSHTYTPTPVGDADPVPQTLTFHQREFTSRALWFDGNNYQTYTPPETAYLGGESLMFDINDNNVAVGAVSVAISPGAQARITECEEADPATSTNPLYVCVWNQWFVRQNALAPNLSVSFLQQLEIPTNQSIYDMNAAKWQLDANGNVISVTQWGTLMERTGEEDLEDFSSYAYAINNNDIAVGQSWTYFNNGQDDFIGNPATRIKKPVVFIGDEVRSISDDTDYIWGSARDINNDNIAIGFMLKEVQGFVRYIGFSYDVDSENFTEMPGFFTGSSTIPNALNDSGLVVGTADIDSSLQVTRRRVGFVYDLNNPSNGFINLNDAIGCDSGLFIVSADAINSHGEILATALEQVDVVDENGETRNEIFIRTVKLNPVSGGQINDCDAEEQIVERQGASTSLFGGIAMLLIGGLITIRRRWSV
ncbi:MAG: Uncharacterised protein [Pseudidiomarina mangrovi]|nr:MAG: Uncharacterised protein [Pseudidiomarina mangrovi]